MMMLVLGMSAELGLPSEHNYAITITLTNFVQKKEWQSHSFYKTIFLGLNAGNWFYL
ncbi:hypothetical protein tloyanaT_08030 [Thalassotalea loyana]|uniref:Uncharacterized protein n=1 Tax=Thalassotalea loyana TaxID=280483 RepID=A0ABQ6H8V1_9GAMM|nr:hypothetical protein tloyanaT_08030 [Thalassotalea loyana]